MKIINLNDIRPWLWWCKCDNSHAKMFYPWSCYFTEKRRHRHLLATVWPRIFAPHFFKIEDTSLLEKLNHETRQKNKVGATEQGNFYWRSYKESITMLLVSLVHQFIWPTFTLVFTRNGTFKYSQKPWMRLKLTMTSIFIMSDRVEANLEHLANLE